MSNFTLNPVPEHGVTRRDITDQFFFFLKQLKKSNLTEKQSLRDIGKAVMSQVRWGSYETSQLNQAARKHPDRLGLVDDDGERTFAQFWEDVNRLALGLQRRGIGEGSRVAVLARNGRATIYPLCARHLLGYHIFMINANASAEQIERVLDFHEIELIIVDEEFLDRMNEGSRNRDLVIGHVDTDEEAGPGEREDISGFDTMQDVIDSARVTDSLPFRPGQSRHIVLTSGTTGMPKGVVRRVTRSPQPAAPILAAIPWRPGMTLMLTAVLFHAYGWANLLMALLTGSTIIARRTFDPAQAIDDIRRYDITAMASAASRLRALYRYMDENGIEKVDGLEFIVSAGSPLTPHEIQEAERKFGRVLCNCYGSTETATLAMARPEELAADPTLSGVVYPGTRVEIRDENDELVPEGETGNIFVGAYDMFLGYTDPTVPVKVVNGLVPMGDKGYFTEGNHLHVLGRADDMVITQSAEKIFPSELEDRLTRDPRIADVTVHGVPDEHFGQALRAYIIRAEGVTPAELDAEEVRRILRESLSDAHAPRDVFFVEEFPRNPMGKVIRPQLPGRSTVE